ncbi:Variant Ionotropic Glutamate Receptor [Penaeus vannamei]|uniref:Variant Ionotropic Glutamate Receptor n=1 Tax=Penaeus vannamei TaxID=6689 RepID=A0A3R7ML25_PENVA|nr:Variant Ionotropic Glutamate Receptor [Penaeus vannamei]
MLPVLQVLADKLNMWYVFTTGPFQRPKANGEQGYFLSFSPHTLSFFFSFLLLPLLLFSLSFPLPSFFLLSLSLSPLSPSPPINAMIHFSILPPFIHFCFSYKLVPAPAGGWGTRQANGSWTGMIGMCERGEVDVVLGPIADSTERSLVIDFSTPLFIDKQIITYLRPTLEPDLGGFVKPFSPLIWILLFLISLLVLGSTFLLLLLRARLFGTLAPSPTSGTIAPAPWQRDFPQHGYSDRTGRAFLWTYGVMITQSMWWFPRSMTGRVLGGAWLLAAFIIATVYKSNLKAMIIIPKVNLPFTNLEEMIEQDKIPYMLMGGSLVYDIFKVTRPRSGSTDGLNKVLNEGYALIVDQNTVKNILHTTFSQVRRFLVIGTLNWLVKGVHDRM